MGREKVGKKGVVREQNTHVEVIEAVFGYAVETGFDVLDLDFSPIRGPEGNIEYLAHLRKCEGQGRIFEAIDILQVTEQAFDMLAKEKK